jgi:guanylate kinase
MIEACSAGSQGSDAVSDAPQVRGTLYIISAPSGAGKTSLVQALVSAEDGIAISVSYTTRPMRPAEREGIDYHFVEPSGFERLMAEGAFLEHARVFDHHYGTLRARVEERLAQGLDLILEIDWQGAQQVRAACPRCLSIFILPPSHAELERRLNTRGGDDAEVIRRRMRDAVNEISHYREYDYLIVNDEFERALADLRAIVRAGRLGLERQRVLQRALLQDLMAT